MSYVFHTASRAAYQGNTHCLVRRSSVPPDKAEGGKTADVYHLWIFLKLLSVYRKCLTLKALGYII
jgi:hypothetical protein